MAEPFSLLVSAASLLELTLKSGKALFDLQSQLRNAPDLIKALSNETQDLAAVLTQLDGTRKAAEAAGFNTADNASLLALLTIQLRNARAILTDLELLTRELAAETSMKRVKWCLKKSQAAGLQRRLREVRGTINHLLVAHASSGNARIELEVRDVRIEAHQNQAAVVQKLDASFQVAHNQTALLHGSVSHTQAAIAMLQGCITEQHQAVREDSATTNQALARMEQQLATILSRSMADGSTQPSVTVINKTSGARRSEALLPPGRNYYDSGFPPETPPAVLNSALYISLGFMGSRCARNCPCKCHIPTSHRLSWRLPGVLQTAIGSLFLGYTGSPVSPPRCDIDTCSRGRHVRLSLTYAFPLWFLGYAIHGFVEASTTGPLTAGIVLRRRIGSFRSTENIIYQAISGNVDGVRRILERNRASVLDVLCTDGRCALSVALSAKASWSQILDVMQCLLLAGADPDYENDDGNIMRHEVARIVLLRIAPPEVCAELEQMFLLSKCVDSLDLTLLHKIVLGLYALDLSEKLQNRDPEVLAQVNARDRGGVTPLIYAVWRGDVLKARALIDAGAAVDEMSNDGYTALMCAALIGSIEVVDLLLAAGADVNKTAERYGNTVLCFAAANDHTGVIRRLLSAGVAIDQRDFSSGDAPLSVAAHYDSAGAVQLLYEEGAADLDALDKWGVTPLMRAVQYNCHTTQSLLLRLGADHLAMSKYSETLLHMAAAFGDEATFETLASFDLKGIDINAEDCGGWTALELFEDRQQSSDDLRLAFHRLLESLDPRSQTRGELDGDDGDQNSAEEAESGAEEEDFVDALEAI